MKRVSTFKVELLVTWSKDDSFAFCLVFNSHHNGLLILSFTFFYSFSPPFILFKFIFHSKTFFSFQDKRQSNRRTVLTYSYLFYLRKKQKRLWTEEEKVQRICSKRLNVPPWLLHQIQSHHHRNGLYYVSNLIIEVFISYCLFETFYYY